MNSAGKSSPTKFWLGWVAANAIGLAVGFAIYFPLVVGFAAEQTLLLQVLLSAAGGALFGASLGIAQWFVLRAAPVPGRDWIWATTAAGVIGGILALVIGQIMGDLWGFSYALAIGGALLGAMLGAGQWVLLRREVSAAGWWVLASALGLILSLAGGRALGGAIYYALLPSAGEATARILATAVFAALMLAGYGIVTGVCLQWLMPRAAAGLPVQAAD